VVSNRRSKDHKSLVRRVNPSELIRNSDMLAEPDYADAFELVTRADGPEAMGWARTTLEGAPLAVRAVLVVGWRVLRFDLKPRSSADQVLGWTIVAADPGTVVLGIRSLVLGQSQLVFQVDGTRLVLSTLIRFKNRRARLIWSVVGIVHRPSLPYLLTHAAEKLQLSD
jgi:hypothetical protein